MKTTARKNQAPAKMSVSNPQPALKVVQDQPAVTPALEPATGKAGKAMAIPPQKQTLNPPAKTLSLQDTLKIVDGLHRKVIQRTNLVNVIDTLESFTIKQVEDEHGQQYTSCEISITDDQRNSWKTKNTFLIAELVRFTLETCKKRLTEIENGINLPEIK